MQNWNTDAVSDLHDACNKYQFGQAFGTILGIIFWLITPHMVQIANAWRHGTFYTFNLLSNIIENTKISNHFKFVFKD